VRAARRRALLRGRQRRLVGPVEEDDSGGLTAVLEPFETIQLVGIDAGKPLAGQKLPPSSIT